MLSIAKINNSPELYIAYPKDREKVLKLTFNFVKVSQY